MSDLLTEMRYGVRSLRRTPIFSVVSILTFAIGIGATTAMFSLVNSVLLTPLPFREPNRLFIIHESIPELRDTYPVLGSNPRSLLAWQRECRAHCAGVAALGLGSAILTGSGAPERLQGAQVSANFFNVIGVPAAVGRTINAEDEAAAVVILSHNLWQRRFGGDVNIVGRTVLLDDKPVQVIGILPASFTLRFADWSPIRSAAMRDRAEFFRPVVFSESMRRSAGEYDQVGLVRTRPESTREHVLAELTSITDAEFREAGVHPQPVVRALTDQIVGDARRPLWLLLAAILTTLLVACLNIAGLLTARWTGRMRELVIRSALGASASRVTRPVLVEALLLSLAGAAIGVLLASASLKLLVATVPVDIPRLQEVTIDGQVLAFAAALTAGVSLLCGLLPGWRASRSNAADTLKATSLSATASGESLRAGKLLIAGQVALTALLLAFGGLLLASFAAVLSVDRGFDATRATAADVTLPSTRYSTEQSRLLFYEAFLERIEAIAGVDSVGMSQRLPLEGTPAVDALVRFEDNTPSFDSSRMSVTNYFYISPGYPSAIGMRLLRGRFPTRQDSGRPVALITESTAERLWPRADAIGQRFFRGDPGRKRVYDVVGVVADLPITSLEQPPGLTAFLPASESARGTMTIVVRTRVPAAAVMRSLRAALDELDNELPLYNVRSIDEVLSSSVASRRFQMLLIGGFSSAALLLACLGLYGVIATAVGRNRRELALRMVLGSSPRALILRVLREGLLPVFAGILIGVAAALALSGVVRASLFGISPHNPAVIASAVVLLFGAAGLACLMPALGAARTSPAEVLRE